MNSMLVDFGARAKMAPAIRIRRTRQHRCGGNHRICLSDLTARDKGRYMLLTSWLDYRIDAGWKNRTDRSAPVHAD